MDCATTDYYGQGCDGGAMVGGFKYVHDHGIVTEESYPHEAKQGECRQKDSVFKISGYKDVPRTELFLKQAVANIGPVSDSIEATDNLQHYTSGVIYDETCIGQLNHGVLAVGYGTEDNQDFWIIKNSWGAAWGEAGYFKLARNRGNNCGVATSASYPIV